MKTLKHRGETIYVELAHYGNGRPAIRLTDVNGLPYALPTCNLPELPTAENTVLIKTYAEHAPFLALLVEAGVVEDTGERITISSYGAQVAVCRLLET